MQSIFLACYLCLQLLALNHHDQTALIQRDSSCDQCLTEAVEKLHLSPDLTIQIEDWLSIKRPTEIMSDPAIAEAIAKLVKEQTVPTTEQPATDEAQQKPSEFLEKVVESLVHPKPKGRSFLRINEILKVGESLISENQEYLATLNSDGRLVLTDADDTVLEKLGCQNEEESQDHIMLLHFSNSVKFYKKVRADPEDFYCSFVTPMYCTQEGVRCYLNLDNDGRLRMYSGDGHLEWLYSDRPEPSANPQPNETPEPQQVEESQEIEYKGQSTLKQNQRLKVGESLVSENGKYKITLNRKGQLETFDSHGKVIRNSGACRNDLPLLDSYNIFMSPENTWRLYWNEGGDFMHYVCASGIPFGCYQTGAECYLKLDNDGILKMFNDKGHVEMDYDYNMLDYMEQNQTPESQQTPIEEDSPEIEYKGKNTLKRNERLRVGESLVSENGRYKTTLSHQGELETFNSHGRLLGKIGGCGRNPPFSDWSVLLTSNNELRYCQNADSDVDHCTCARSTPWHCALPGVECYFKLDNDGLIKIFDTEGKIEDVLSYI